MMSGNKRLKKAILICGAVILGMVVVMVLLSVFLRKSEAKPEPEPEPSSPVIRFYPSYEGNVRENKVYQALDTQFYLCEPAYGAVNALPDDVINASPELRLLKSYFDCLIDGNAEGLRSLFTPEALAAGPIADFAGQMIYDMKVTRVSDDATGGERKITYRLEYMIYRNDGTYRRDVGSDAIRPEFLTLTPTADDDFQIVSVQR